MDYLRYYLNCLLPLAAIAGFLLGDQWVWLGIGTLPLLLVADTLSPQDYAPRNIKNGALADVVIYVQTLLVLATFVAFAWRRCRPACSGSPPACRRRLKIPISLPFRELIST